MERKVGEEFFSGFYGKSYEVLESKYCFECSFWKHNKCQGVLSETGDCMPKYRKDKKHVIFKEAKWRKK